MMIKINYYSTLYEKKNTNITAINSNANIFFLIFLSSKFNKHALVYVNILKYECSI